jgi:hypothetical protein
MHTFVFDAGDEMLNMQGNAVFSDPGMRPA